ncbi:hypothetical protein NE562_05540 [Butyricicoccus faecihominis]|uniref:hypothetical protein n=1 Tax=Butyricicoccus faecihominis TaxID=1712515 RepID=UPI002479EA67|nr:hypothetical protein [Butyricicoccus faecihominis]MCQ5129115.1 hypothetical protein [Butyricicoccus faecihominis]
MTDIKKKIHAYLRHAEAIGRAGGTCPFVPGIAPTMKSEDNALLIRAWVLRNFPPDTESKEFRDELEDLIVQLARRWQFGALSRV